MLNTLQKRKQYRLKTWTDLGTAAPDLASAANTSARKIGMKLNYRYKVYLELLKITNK